MTTMLVIVGMEVHGVEPVDYEIRSERGRAAGGTLPGAFDAADEAGVVGDHDHRNHGDAGDAGAAAAKHEGAELRDCRVVDEVVWQDAADGRLHAQPSEHDGGALQLRHELPEYECHGTQRDELLG